MPFSVLVVCDSVADEIMTKVVRLATEDETQVLELWLGCGELGLACRVVNDCCLWMSH
jgi:hypothetical protein